MNLLFSILGLIGGLLCCVGDIFLDLKGSDNQKLGTSKNIDSNWLKMAEWRFGVSIIFAMLGVIGVGLGFYSIANQIYASHSVLAVILAITGYSGVIGGIFVHSSLCIQAVIYKRIMSGGEKNFELADHTLEGFYKAIPYPDGSGYEARFTACGICTLMRELGLYDLVPALCRLDYTMSEEGGASNFVREYTLASGGPYCDCGYKKRRGKM